MAEPTPPTVLVVNPGGTSTKLAVYRGEEEQLSAEVRHDQDEIARMPSQPQPRRAKKPWI